jgi:oxepin-CoA hydrolase / 3-oxo-5,6-dehydrosuberyl-CoA semialdehyde dehydrogenase
MLQSYLQDTWVSPSRASEPPTDVRDAVTGDVICQVSTAGLDLASAFRHARHVGRPGLRELTFHQRADLLAAFAATVRERRDHLYHLSARAGATLTDARFDVDGGIRVLRDYASRARTELPDATFLTEGPAERLSRGEQFLGLHVCTPSRGVVLQVNAFNFPVRAPLEKLAKAVLAGMPSIIKPATPTAYITKHLVRILAQTGALPPGVVQMVAGSCSPGP